MKVVAVYSIKGGVGKTSTAVNVAWNAARTLRVLLWDLDPQGAATFLLEVKPKLKGGVDSLIRGKTSAQSAIRSTEYDGLDVLPADDGYRELDLVFDATKKSTHRIEKVLESVARDYDLVVLDCPPGASLVAENALSAADLVLLPLVPAPLSLRSLDQVNAIVAESGHPTPVLAFLTMVDRRKGSHREAIATLPAQRKEVVDIVIPATVIVERMGAERAPVGVYAANSEPARMYAELSRRVLERVAAKRGHRKG